MKMNPLPPFSLFHKPSVSLFRPLRWTNGKRRRSQSTQILRAYKTYHSVTSPA